MATIADSVRVLTQGNVPDVSKGISAFRTDRLYKPEILNEDAVPEPEDFKLEDYSRQFIEMFEGEELDQRRKETTR